jgi:Berberine and berberine like
VITDALEVAQHDLPGLGVALAFDAFGGAINRVAPAATAFVHRDAIAQLQMIVTFSGAAQYAAVHSWLGHAAAAIVPHSNGQAYQNYIDPTLADWRSAYYGSNLARLQAVRRRYDPDHLFNFAQAIP